MSDMTKSAVMVKPLRAFKVVVGFESRVSCQAELISAYRSKAEPRLDIRIDRTDTGNCHLIISMVSTLSVLVLRIAVLRIVAV